MSSWAQLIGSPGRDGGSGQGQGEEFTQTPGPSLMDPDGLIQRPHLSDAQLTRGAWVPTPSSAPAVATAPSATRPTALNASSPIAFPELSVLTFVFDLIL